jgi:hypothetical protein
MTYRVEWLDDHGEMSQFRFCASASEALRFSRSLTPLQPREIWAESDRGDRFLIRLGADDPEID